MVMIRQFINELDAVFTVTLRFEHGWFFKCQSRKYMETGKLKDNTAFEGSLFVEISTEKLYAFPPDFSEERIEDLIETQDFSHYAVAKN